MASGFADLAGTDIASVLEELGFARPSAIQRAAMPVIRRGSNVVIHAATGAGATAAYGVALIERLKEHGITTGPQILVIVPTQDRASNIALQLGQLGKRAGVRATVRAAGWSGDAEIVVVPAGAVMRMIESSALKLESVKAIVLHDLSAMLALGHEPSVESLLSTVPKDAQRIVITSEAAPAVDKLAEAHVRRALHIPARPAVPGEEPAAPAPSTEIEYHVAVPGQLTETVAIIAGGKPGATVFARSTTAADEAREALGLRGVSAAVTLYGEGGSGGPAIGLGAPLDAESLRAAFPDGGVVAIAPVALTHLRNIARQANVNLRAGAAATRDPAALERFRDRIRKAVAEEDIDAQLLVIAPLLEEFSAAEIAAAAAALLRKRSIEAAAAVAPATPTGASPAFVKLFLSIGQRDGSTAREIVGAITGEAGLPGDRVGRVEIRDTFSIVEVAADAADRVIRALNGTSLRGRSVRVDYDRRGGAARRTLPSRRTRPAQ